MLLVTINAADVKIKLVVVVFNEEDLVPVRQRHMHQPYQIHPWHRGLPFWCNVLLRSPQSLGLQTSPRLTSIPRSSKTKQLFQLVLPSRWELSWQHLRTAIVVRVGGGCRARQRPLLNCVFQSGGKRQQTVRTLVSTSEMTTWIRGCQVCTVSGCFDVRACWSFLTFYSISAVVECN